MVVLTRTISIEWCEVSLIGMGSLGGEKLELVCRGMWSKKSYLFDFLKSKQCLYASGDAS